MLVGFEYRVVLHRILTTKIDEYEYEYYPQFKAIYSKYDIRKYLFGWKYFKYLLPERDIESESYAVVRHRFFFDTYLAKCFLKNFSTEVTLDKNKNPILFNEYMLNICEPVVVKSDV